MLATQDFQVHYVEQKEETRMKPVMRLTTKIYEHNYRRCSEKWDVCVPVLLFCVRTALSVEQGEDIFVV